MRNTEATASTLKSLKDYGGAHRYGRLCDWLRLAFLFEVFADRHLENRQIIYPGYLREPRWLRDCVRNRRVSQNPDLSLAAEGVETVEQRDFSEIQHCERMQRYLVSKPRPADHVVGFLAGMKQGEVA
jgi:hypothetical protein